MAKGKEIANLRPELPKYKVETAEAHGGEEAEHDGSEERNARPRRTSEKPARKRHARGRPLRNKGAARNG